MDWYFELHKALEDELMREATGIADGNVTSFEEYRHRIGVRKGLKRAVQILDDIARHYGEESDLIS